MRLHRPSYAAVVAHLALAVALSTGAAAAVVITGANVKNGTLTSVDIKARSLTAGNIATGTLTGKQIKKASVPADRLSGPVPVDTTKVYDKAQSDARFLGIGGTAANAVNATSATNAASAANADNAAKLGGLDASAFAKGNATFSSVTTAVPLDVSGDVELIRVPGFARVTVLGCTSSDASVQVNNLDPSTAGQIWHERPDFLGGIFSGTGWGSVTSSHGTTVWTNFTLTRAPGAGVAQIQMRGAVAGGVCIYVISAEVIH